MKEFITDTHALVGALVGLAIAFGSVFFFGQDLIHAPILAAQAQKRAEAVEKMARENRAMLDQFRIAFCTKEDFLSPSGYAALECGEIDRRPSRRTNPLRNGSQ